MIDVKFLTKKPDAETVVLATASLEFIPRVGEYISFHKGEKFVTYEAYSVEWWVSSNRASIDVWCRYSSGG